MKAILMYHSVDSSGSAISINEKAFRAHIAWLASGAVAVVPLENIMDVSDQDAVAITFDDGFQNFADIAWPLLRAHSLPATLFVVSARVGRTNSWCIGDRPVVPELPLADWDTLGRLADEGVTIGCHTQTHRNLKLIRGEQLKDEIRGAAQSIVAHIGKWPKTFSYPYGAFDEAVITAVGTWHSLACTTELRAVQQSDERLRLPRLDAYYLRAPGMLESYGSARFRQYLSFRRAGRAVRAVLVSEGAHP